MSWAEAVIMLNGVPVQDLFHGILVLWLHKKFVACLHPTLWERLQCGLAKGLSVTQIREHNAQSFSLHWLDNVIKLPLQCSPPRGSILEYRPDQCAGYLNKVTDRHARFLKNVQKEKKGDKKLRRNTFERTIYLSSNISICNSYSNIISDKNMPSTV